MAECMLRNAPGFSIENIASNEENDRKCGVILEHLRFNQIVQSLNFNYTPYFGSGESCKALGEVVGRSTTLRNLSLHGSGMDGDGLEYIIEGLLSNPNSTLQRLEVGSNINLRKKGAELVEKLLLRNLPNLISLGIWGSGFTSEETAPVARALAKNTTLIELSCGVGYGITHPETEGPLSWIMKAFTPIDCLTPEQASYQDDTYNQTVRALRMNFEYEKGVLENLVQMLAHNSSLEVLALRFFHLNRDQWGEVWKAMKYNSKLEEMDLYRCGQGLGDAFDDMMDFLQANRTLKRIHLGETSLVEAGQAALVKQQLERNARLSDYLSTLNRSLKFVPPRIGRLFLCGYPRAGKTTLRRSMIGAQGNMINRTMFSATACMAKQRWVFPAFFDRRTQGIEIRLLKDSGDKKIAVWDMAGQDEYHALHDSHYMFPDINQACVFLFLYRPVFDEKGRWQEEASSQCFERELCYWLTFITSNSRKTGWVLPQVSVVLTHLDKLAPRFGKVVKTRKRRYTEWANAKVDVLRTVFQGRVDLHTQVHAVDAFSTRHARAVDADVFNRFDHLFSKTLPEVPAACEEMNLFLAKWTVRNNSYPIITQAHFFDLCKKNVKELDALFQEVPPELADEAQEIREAYREKNELAVASYLHDVGSIIHFPKSTFVVVDPNWLGKVFLGKLFRPGDDTFEPIILSTRNGCVSHGDLQAALEDFMHDRNYRGFRSGDLIELMKELELCYEETSETDPPIRSYFIPNTLTDPNNLAQHGKRRLQWTVKGGPGSSPVYSGFRLQCMDQSRTFLSPGFFQRFQVHLQRFLRDHHIQLTYEIEKNLIRLKHDGLELLVEKSGDNGLLDGDYVDILAKSYSPGLSGRHPSTYMNLVDQLRVFCASREGCPGVALQEALLRPGCVERLTLCCYRKNQAVVKETLKKEVVRKLFESDKLEIWQDDGYAKSVTGMSQIYKHEFPAVPTDEGLPNEWIEAMTMLNLIDVKEAIFKYRSTVSQHRYIIFQAVDEVQRVTLTSDMPSTTRGNPSKPEESDEMEGPEGPPDGPDNWNWYIKEMERRIRDPLERLLRNVETNILTKLQENTLLLEHIEASMEDMQMLHQKLYSSLVEKLDQVMGFTAEMQDIPGLPYFSDQDVGLTQRLVAFIQIGKPLRLHFMCENPSQPHYIKDQKGLPLLNLLKGEKYKKLRPLILGSIKLLFILVKAGLHVTAGIGNAIPDFQSVPGAEPLTAVSLTGETVMGNIKCVASETMDGTLADAWGCIETVMGPIKARGQIADIFQLHQVQFKSAMLSRYLTERRCFWICDKCRRHAERADLLRQKHASPEGIGMSDTEV